MTDRNLQQLTKMGVKMVTKPSECTHLVVKSVVKTEKILCAMVHAPYVLGEKWARISVKVLSEYHGLLLSTARTDRDGFVAESQYAIKDEETEKKYHFDLADALKRAKQNAGKLFGGIKSYVTRKVPVDTNLLKGVVAANGGQVRRLLVLLHALIGSGLCSCLRKPRRCASSRGTTTASSSRVVSIWRPLAQHYKINTQELILTSALRQIDWDDKAYVVLGSY